MKLLCTFIVSLISLSGFSQSPVKKDSTRHYNHPAFYIGYQNQTFDNLNARLIKYFPRSIPQNAFGIGLGGKTAMNNWLVQGDISAAFGSNGNGNKGYTNIFLLGFNFDAGLFLTKPGAVRVYPFAGLSLDLPIVSAKIRTDNINFDSVLSSAQVRQNMEPVSMSTFFASWRGGLAIDFGNPKNHDRPYSFGIKAGYKQSFNNGTWRMDNSNNLLNEPSDRLQQWFASIVFYGATNHHKYRKK